MKTAKRRATIITLCVGMFIGAFSVTSCAWPQANADVVELKALFKEYRARVVPAVPTQTATLDKLADHIESSFDSMDRLTK